MMKAILLTFPVAIARVYFITEALVQWRKSCQKRLTIPKRQKVETAR